MKISLNWISDYVDIRDVDVDWLVSKLTVTTSEIEGVEKIDDDVVIEIDNKSLTNRPDLWCHYGMAREVAAITGRPLKDIDYIRKEELKNDSPALNIQIADREKCLRYSAIKIDNVKVSVSPECIAARLANCGIRPINVIVDIANYVMLDIGQPLHTFDKKDIELIRVSSLEKGIKFMTLDGVERDIPADTLMIHNQDKPLAVAGIIGGEESAVTENTKGIILESATFEGVSIRKTSQALGIRTDASARYEKFLDTAITTIAVGRFLRLLKQHQPDIKLPNSLFDNIINEIESINISLQHSYIETYLGNGIPKETVIGILRSLQFEVEEKDWVYNIIVPTFRATKDISCKADIIEEILRVYGYDNIKGTPYKMEVIPTEKNTMKELIYSIEDILVKKFNFNEVHSYSWYDSNWLKKLCCEQEETLNIANSGVKQFEKLRTDIMPNLLKIIYDNKKNYGEINIFEIGRVFLRNEGDLTQPRHLTAAICSDKDEKEAYMHIKGICSYLLRNTKNIEADFVLIKAKDKENCVCINYMGIELGHLYSISASNLKIFSNKPAINILDINLELLNDITKEQIRYKPISKYPDTYLDFSILSADDINYFEIKSLVDRFVHRLILKTSYVDTYSGENVPANMKSTTIRMIIGDSSRTLQIEEINNLKELFIKYINENGLQLR